MDKVTLTIDGQKVVADKDMTVLEAALENGIYIPHLCYHPDLEPVGVCRLCMVEIEGRPMTTSCNTPVAGGMIVKTDTPEISKIRQAAVELLIVNHDGECLQCAKDMQCELQKVSNYVGISDARLKRLRRTIRKLPVDTSNPFFNRDPNKCILCGICVRTCEQLQGVSAIDFAFRGYSAVVSPFGNGALAESICESCGECMVRCPVGALTPKTSQQPSHEAKTVCTYCGCGCGIYLGIRGDRIVSVHGDEDCCINHGTLCVKGRFGYEFINSPERLTTPLIKHNGKFVEAEWDEALDFVAGKLADYKGDRFATISSAKCTNEENYVIQKFTRGVMGTNNIDHCARL